MRPMTDETAETPLASELRLISGLTVKLAEPLARYTSMKIGGPADLFLEVETDATLVRVLAVLHEWRTAVCLLGNGSNILVSDHGVRGAVIHLIGDFRKLEWREEGETVSLQVGAACAVTQLVRAAARKGYAGLEFAEGIPGSVGGALVMNAGAYGSEFEKVVDRVVGVTEEGKAVRFGRSE